MAAMFPKKLLSMKLDSRRRVVMLWREGATSTRNVSLPRAYFLLIQNSIPVLQKNQVPRSFFVLFLSSDMKTLLRPYLCRDEVLTKAEMFKHLKSICCERHNSLDRIQTRPDIGDAEVDSVTYRVTVAFRYG